MEVRLAQQLPVQVQTDPPRARGIPSGAVSAWEWLIRHALLHPAKKEKNRTPA